MCKADPSKHVQAINSDLTLKYYKLPVQLSKKRIPDILLKMNTGFRKNLIFLKIVILVKAAKLQEHPFSFFSKLANI